MRAFFGLGELCNNVFQQAIYPIPLWFSESKHNYVVMSKQLLKGENVLRHPVKALTPDGYSYYAICEVSPVSF